MIGIKINGGLGNQMFQYAFITSASYKKKQTFFLEKEGTPIELYKYFKLKKNAFNYIDILFFNHDGFRLFFSHYLRQRFYQMIHKCFISKEIAVLNTDKPENVIDLISNQIFFEGYFQSPLYFQNNLKNISESFKLKDKIQARYKKTHQFPAQKKKCAYISAKPTILNWGI